MEITIETVAAIRAQLYDAGFRPVPIYTWDHPVEDAGKRPLGKDWTNIAREDPPGCLNFPPVAHALNTGVLCDGLRAIDIDVDDPEIASRCRSLVVQRFGEAPIRMRRNSPRCLVLYRAATGTPSKVVLAGRLGKIEVLGKGQQFVAFGRHPTGAELEWFPEPPGEESLGNLPPIEEDDLLELLDQIAPIIDAAPPQRVNGHDHSSGEPQADPLRIAAALNAIANAGPADWEAWNRIGMAVWRATGGSEIGWQAFNAWSARNASYDSAETRKRWEHYAISPPTSIGAGTLFHMARPVEELPPPEIPPPDYDHWEALNSDARQQQFRERDTPAAENVPGHGEDGPHLKIVYFNDIQPNLNAADFVEGLLIEGGMSVIYGESNSGKTFFTSDLAIHVAMGWPWCGRAVEQSGVIYCALEGAHGISNRIAAFRETHSIDQLLFIPFGVVASSINMLDPNADTQHLIDLIRAAAKHMSVPVRLIVIDTLSRALSGGNENASEDMGALVINTDRVRLETGAHVCFVHHCGKDSAKGARGHSSLVAATDTEIEVADDEGQRSARVTKQREMECVGEFSFTLKTIVLGKNRREKDVTSCIVVHAAADQTRSKRPRFSGHTKKAFEILTNLMATHGQQGHAGTPDGARSVPDEWWRDRFYQHAMPGAEQAAKQKAFRRAADALVDCRSVAMNDGRVWLPYGESNE